MKYKLDTEEQIEASRIGLLRAQRYIPQFTQAYDRKADNPGDWDRLKGNFFKFAELQMEATAAEMVVSKYLGIDCGDLRDERFKSQADVGANIEVKHTAWDDGHLIISPRDRSSDIAVLVTGSCPNYRIAGWIPIAVAKQPRYKSNKDSSYWVGQINLRSIEHFRSSTYGEIQVSSL